jgi:hypothetical protein
MYGWRSVERRKFEFSTPSAIPFTAVTVPMS